MSYFSDSDCQTLNQRLRVNYDGINLNCKVDTRIRASNFCLFVDSQKAQAEILAPPLFLFESIERTATSIAHDEPARQCQMILMSRQS
jgi:hypothetical protein